MDQLTPVSWAELDRLNQQHYAQRADERQRTATIERLWKVRDELVDDLNDYKQEGDLEGKREEIEKIQSAIDTMAAAICEFERGKPYRAKDLLHEHIGIVRWIDTYFKQMIGLIEP